VYVNGFVDPEAGELLQSALGPLASPVTGPEGERDPRSTQQRNADGLVELARRALDAGDLPVTGGFRPHLSLVVPWRSVQVPGVPASSSQVPSVQRPNAQSPNAQSPNAQWPTLQGASAVQDSMTAVGLLIANATSAPAPPASASSANSLPATALPEQPRSSGTLVVPRQRPPSEPTEPIATDLDPPASPDPFSELAAIAGTKMPAQASWGAVLPPEVARRYACDAEITRVIVGDQPHLLEQLLSGLPSALGGSVSEILDLGRTQRLASRAQRRALAVRDGGCVFPGCGRPPAWCDAHHLWHWLDGGPTDLWNLALLCRWHHTFVHEGGWLLERDADGRFQALPPTDDRLRRLTTA
jgi:hypothetical protein